jgi:hypothetical protein
LDPSHWKLQPSQSSLISLKDSFFRNNPLIMAADFGVPRLLSFSVLAPAAPNP